MSNPFVHAFVVLFVIGMVRLSIWCKYVSAWVTLSSGRLSWFGLVTAISGLPLGESTTSVRNIINDQIIEIVAKMHRTVFSLYKIRISPFKGSSIFFPIHDLLLVLSTYTSPTLLKKCILTLIWSRYFSLWSFAFTITYNFYIKFWF